MKRSFKFYRKNEADVMESLGLKPTLNSGSTWIEKEDGQNDYVICQLKSTDAQSIKINQNDIRKLEYNALTSHKVPMFAIQFLNTGEVWLMVKPLDIQNIVNYIETGECEVERINLLEEKEEIKRKIISSSLSAREEFENERASKYNKVKTAK